MTICRLEKLLRATTTTHNQLKNGTVTALT
jgi:hypothetical protein